MKQAVSVDRKAVARWVAGRDPADADIVAMEAWFKVLENENGPPPIIGYTAAGDNLTEGPHGESVAFSYVAIPVEWVNEEGPYGLIGILGINEV